MITRDNIQEVVNQITLKDKIRIKNNTSKEYIVLYLHCFNVGCRVEIILTNDYYRYRNVSNNGNCILDSDDFVFDTIREEV